MGRSADHHNANSKATACEATDTAPDRTNRRGRVHAESRSHAEGHEYQKKESKKLPKPAKQQGKATTKSAKAKKAANGEQTDEKEIKARRKKHSRGCLRYYVNYSYKLEFFRHLVNTCNHQFVTFFWYSNYQVPPAVGRVMSEAQRPLEPILNYYWWLINSPNGLLLSMAELNDLLAKAQELGMIIDWEDHLYLD